jgi:Fungal chitosanase of glycosyl hydrolase group 75
MVVDMKHGSHRGSIPLGLTLAAMVAGACGGAPAPEPASPPAASSASAPRVSGPPGCAKDLVAEVVGTTVWRLPGGTAIGFKAGMIVDAHGAPRAYHKDDAKALDSLANAGKDGNWSALVTDTGKPDGKPLLQGQGDPAPGYFISTTALFDKAKPARSPARYVDAGAIPYVALPPDAKEWGAQLGDFAVVMNAHNGRIAFAILADESPPAKLGEGSIALADAVSIASSPKDGGVPHGVVYAVFTRSGNGTPRSAADIDREGQRLLDALGGRPVLATCFR